jgi:DinB family protein
MISLGPWLERRWAFDLPVAAFAAVVERLDGMPVRAAALVDGISDTLLSSRPSSGWSVKEHLGHLDDLHALDARRLDEFLAGSAELSSADPKNQQTEDNDHRVTPTAQLLERLATNRRRLVFALEELSEADIGRTARHPRLGVPMRVIDWAQFVADHDDHHLAAARFVLRSLKARGAVRS